MRVILHNSPDLRSRCETRIQYTFCLIIRREKATSQKATAQLDTILSPHNYLRTTMKGT